MTIRSAIKTWVAIICAILFLSATDSDASVFYKTIQVGAVGRSNGFNLFGVIPITSPNRAVAKANLYKSVTVPLVGKQIELTHEQWFWTRTYWGLFSITRITVMANVVQIIVHTPTQINET